MVTGSEWKLIVISKRTFLGLFPGDHQVYRIDRIAVLPLAVGEVPDVELDVSVAVLTGKCSIPEFWMRVCAAGPSQT